MIAQLSLTLALLAAMFYACARVQARAEVSNRRAELLRLAWNLELRRQALCPPVLPMGVSEAEDLTPTIVTVRPKT